MEFKHVSVLRDESIECLNVKKGGVYIDGTLGGGGHSLCVLALLDGTGKLIGIDKDKDAIEVSTDRLKSFANFFAVNDSHENILQVLEELNIDHIDGALLDLGVSSYQLDETTRGFSYMTDAPLDMRMNKDNKFSAYDVVNSYSEEELIKIFFDYGEEKYSKRIARGIVERRKETEIKTTLELVDVIKGSIPSFALREKGHPAKRVFQAIRIEVNGELVGLEKTIKDIASVLNPGGRIVIISFHSLEDRIVKKTFEALEGRCTCPKSLPQCVCGAVCYGKVITKKPIVASETETDENSRSKSAKLRVFERIYK